MVPRHMPLSYSKSTSANRHSHNLQPHIAYICQKPIHNSGEASPPCVHCLRGEGNSGDLNLIQCERCLRWIHSQYLPKHISKDQLTLVEGWTCHDCEASSTLYPCPQQLCTIGSPPTPHTVEVIHKLLGARKAVYKYLLK